MEFKTIHVILTEAEHKDLQARAKKRFMKMKDYTRMVLIGKLKYSEEDIGHMFFLKSHDKFSYAQVGREFGISGSKAHYLMKNQLKKEKDNAK